MKKACRQPYCPTLVESGYCEKHEKNNTTSFKTKKAHPWYNLPIWKGNANKPLHERGGLRANHLMQNPFCVDCKEEGVLNDVTGPGKGVVDHDQPFNQAPTERERWELFTNPENFKTLCVHHHAVKTGRGE